MSCSLSSGEFLSAQLGFKTSTEEAAAVYSDDAMRGFLHFGALFVASVVGFTVQVFDSRARAHGLALNFGVGKTEAILVLRGTEAKALRQEIAAVGGISAEGFTLQAVGAYKNLCTLVTSTPCPTQDAARRISLATAASSRIVGHVRSARQFDLAVKLQATAFVVDAT